MAVAGRNGRALVRGIRAEGLSFERFELSRGETRLNTTFLDSPSGRVVRTFEPGPRWFKREEAEFYDFFRNILCRASLLVLSGSLPPGLSPRFYADLICEARAHALPVFLDTSGPALQAGLKARPFAVKPNQQEAEDFLGYRLTSRRAVRKALHSFLDCGMKMVLLTLGGRGLAVADGKSRYFVSVPRYEQGHAVGCGDAALAGLIAGLEGRHDLAGCARYAAACGAANLLSDVPGGIARRAVKRIMTKVIIEDL
jgi:tagatose 6-phosphate kinase